MDNDADNDGVCDADEVTGCTDPAACNYDSDPTTDTDNTLCTLRRWSLRHVRRRPDRGQRRDDDGVCDADEVTGCTDPAACNYDSDPLPIPTTPSAPSSMAYARPVKPGLIVDNDADDDGVCDANEVTGCTDPQPATTTATRLPILTTPSAPSSMASARPVKHGVIVDNDGQ